MLKVSDLLSLPQFDSFRLISSPDGLNNIVGGSSILEWESPKEIATDFAPDDFVMTTLYMYRDELDRADEALKALIKRRVAAIAIKTTFTDTCSEEVLKMADLYKIPIFMYQDVFMEDLIFAIESAVYTDSSNDIALDYLKYLMECDSGKIDSAARKLNPLFLNDLMCLCLIPASAGDQATLDNALAAYRKTFPTTFPLARSRDSFIKCSGCILYIHTWEGDPERPEDILKNIEHLLGKNLSPFTIGFSDPKCSLSLLKEAVEESLTAAVSSHLEKEGFKIFSEVGADSFLLPFLEEPRFKQFYERTLAAITAHDERYKADLLDTLICYTESDWDINLTAKKMFQHPNTIRHRLEKIKTITGISSSGDMSLQFHVFSRMHKIRNIFGNDSLI